VPSRLPCRLAPAKWGIVSPPHSMKLLRLRRTALVGTTEELVEGPASMGPDAHMIVKGD
jgi:hypothetical protein